MKILKWCIAAVVVAAALTVGALKYREKKLDGQIWYLRSENNRLRGEAYRRVSAASPARAAVTAPMAGAGATVATTPARVVEEYRNDGRATARAALQTLAWCCDRGDVETLIKLTQLEPAARAKAEAYYASLPADARAQWKSMDEMVATFVALGAQVSPFPSADVLDAAVMEPQGEDRMLLRLHGTHKDRLAFRRGADGNWGYAMDAAMMERCLSMVREIPVKGR